MSLDLPPANEAMLPQARQGSYFFNGIGRFLPVMTGRNRPGASARRRRDQASPGSLE